MCGRGLDRKWLSGYVNNMIPIKVGMWVSGFVLFTFECLCIMYRAGGSGDDSVGTLAQKFERLVNAFDSSPANFLAISAASGYHRSDPPSIADH